MQRLKRQKIQDILDQQNATIEADMVRDTEKHTSKLIYIF